MEPIVSVAPATQELSDKAKLFLRNLCARFGAPNLTNWHNYVNTVEQRAYVINLKNLNDANTILKEVFDFNKSSGERRICVVPVAGYPSKYPAEGCSPLDLFSSEARAERIKGEFAGGSYSIAALSTAKNADIILRVTEAAQTIRFYTKEGRQFVAVSPGVTFEKMESECAKRDLAPTCEGPPTIQKVTPVGLTSNGGFGPSLVQETVSTFIEEMVVIDPVTGKDEVLSKEKNTAEFRAFRDAHLGSIFVKEQSFPVEKAYNMERVHTLYKNFDELEAAFKQESQTSKPHFIFMWVPLPGKDMFQIRTTRFARTDKKETGCKNSNFGPWSNIMKAEAAEGLIDKITRSPLLFPFYNFILEFAAKTTFGDKREVKEVAPVAKAVHVFDSYSENPFGDLNLYILVSSYKEADELLLGLGRLIWNKCIELGECPLLDVFARVVRGIRDFKGELGIAPTTVDKEEDFFLAFELVAFKGLVSRNSYKVIENAVVDYLKGKKLRFHYGKDMLEWAQTISNIFVDVLDQQRSNNFKEGFYRFSHGKENVRYIPTLTPQKAQFLEFEAKPKEPRGLLAAKEKERVQEPAAVPLTSEEEVEALGQIREMAKQVDNKAIKKQVDGLLASRKK
jgi:hypothetical protein